MVGQDSEDVEPPFSPYHCQTPNMLLDSMITSTAQFAQNPPSSILPDRSAGAWRAQVPRYPLRSVFYRSVGGRPNSARSCSPAVAVVGVATGSANTCPASPASASGGETQQRRSKIRGNGTTGSAGLGDIPRVQHHLERTNVDNDFGGKGPTPISHHRPAVGTDVDASRKSTMASRTAATGSVPGQVGPSVKLAHQQYVGDIR